MKDFIEPVYSIHDPEGHKGHEKIIWEAVKFMIHKTGKISHVEGIWVLPLREAKVDKS